MDDAICRLVLVEIVGLHLGEEMSLMCPLCQQECAGDGEVRILAASSPATATGSEAFSSERSNEKKNS